MPLVILTFCLLQPTFILFRLRCLRLESLSLSFCNDSTTSVLFSGSLGISLSSCAFATPVKIIRLVFRDQIKLMCLSYSCKDKIIRLVY